MSHTDVHQDRCAALGLSPTQQVRAARRASTLAELRSWMLAGIDSPPEPTPLPLVPQDVDERDDDEALRLAHRHAVGEIELPPEVTRRLDERCAPYPMTLETGHDLVVDGKAYRIDSNAGFGTSWDTVTLKSGGYLEIVASGTFQCNTLIKEGDASAGAAADILIHGTDGVTPPQAPTGTHGHDGLGGRNAHCEAGGGILRHKASRGQDGTAGGPGGPGVQGGHAGPGPVVNLFLGTVTGNLSLLCRGGNGGDGGLGGRGGHGGNGGKGGNGNNCGAFSAKGKRGGNTGAGGPGGPGAGGGEGGAGPTVQVTWKPGSSEDHMVFQNMVGTGGRVSNGGTGGPPGKPGPNGHGAKGQGSTASSGKNGLKSGNPGESGSLGSLTVNGTGVT